MRVHYSAIPGRDEAWAAAERAKYRSQALWEQEQEIKPGVGGGERLLRDVLLQLFDKIVVRDASFRPQSNWSYGAGFDYGKSRPTSYHVYGSDHRGILYALAEHYVAGTMNTPRIHSRDIHNMAVLDPEGNTINYSAKVGSNIFADPSIFSDYQHQSSGDAKTIGELYADEGLRMQPGMKGDDLGCIDRLLQMWLEPEPKFKIWLPQKYQYNKKSEGTYSDGCPNLVWELFGIRRAEYSPVQAENRAPTEKIVQKNNHAFDDLKYFLSSRPRKAEFTPEERWRQKAELFNKQHPALSDFERTNMQIAMRNQHDREQRATGVSKWH